MINYNAGEYTIQEHVQRCGHLMNLPPRNYLINLLNRKEFKTWELDQYHKQYFKEYLKKKSTKTNDKKQK